MRKGLFFLFILLTWMEVRGQQPFHKGIVISDEVVTGSVSAVGHDPNGCLLVATAGGVFTSSGSAFKFLFKTDVVITAIVPVAGKTLLGFADGTLRWWAGGTLRQIDMSATGEKVNDILLLHDSTYLVAFGMGGIVLGSGDKVQDVLTDRNGLADDYVHRIVAGRGDTLYAGTDAGLVQFRVQGSKLQLLHTFSQKEGLHDNIVRAMTPCKGGVLAGGQRNGLSLLCSGIAGAKSSDWEWGEVNDIVKAGANEYWVATSSGYLIEATVNERIVATRELCFLEKPIKRLITDRAGNTWCNTADGLTLLAPPYLRDLRVREHYSLKQLTAMSYFNGSLVYATGNSIYAVQQQTGTAKLIGKTREVVTAMWADTNKRLWIGTLGEGILCMTGDGRIHTISCQGELSNKHVLSIAGIGDTLWIAGLGGVDEVLSLPKAGTCRFLRQHSKRTGIGSDYIYQLYADRKGNMLMATDGAGLCRYAGGRYEHIAVPGRQNEAVVYSVAEDATGQIWIAPMHKGLARYAADKWSLYDKGSGLNDLSVSAIAPLPDGRMVVVHSKGIDEYYPAEDGFRHYNRRLGVDIDSTSGNLNCYATDSAGNVYIPYEHGFIIFRATCSVPDIRPGIKIDRISLFSETISPGRNSFAAQENAFTFHFTGINFANPDRLHYRYKLTGFSDEWIETSDQSATYPQLPPGTYTFVVQASLTQDRRRTAEARYSFVIRTPFWKEPWFVLSALLVAGVAVVLVVRNREQKLKQLAVLEQEKHNYEYEYLKSQVNPHFLFNSLNTLASLIEEDEKAATEYTINLSDFYRNLLSYNDNELISVGEEMELLKKYVYIQQSRFGSALDINIKVDEDTRKNRKIVPMAMQLLVENAIKHNVVSPSSPLRVDIYAEQEWIVVENSVKPKLKKEKGAGLGLKNLVKRYAIHGDRRVAHFVSDNKFIVKIPLL
ncbi:MAG: histidine kinase [Taibaiella sp.]|nr:histidine kinase [Taibaiella sp.]